MTHFGGWLRFLGLWLFVIPAALAIGGGCRGRDPVDQVRLLRVESPVISADAPLELSAEGLPSGRSLQVVLKGTLASAGQDERKLDVSLVGHVLSPERLSIAIDPARFARWGRATFEGELVVRCDTPAPRGCEGALSGVRFEVELLGQRQASALRYQVDRLLPSLGIGISDADSAAHGLLVAQVVEGSLAARAGLLVGDTIVRSNGVSLHGLADLVPGPNAETLALWVRRASGAQLAVRVPLAEGAPLADPRVLGLCLVACPVLLFVLLRLGWLSPASLLVSAHARVVALRGNMGWGFVVGAGLSLLFGVYSVVWAGAFDPFVVLVVHLAGWLVLRGVDADRAARVGRVVTELSGLWGGALAVAAVSGTRDWSLLMRDQGAAPWAWNAFSRLPLSLAMWLYVAAAAGLHGAADKQVISRPHTLLAERALAALMATLCAGLFLGGAYLPPSAGTGTTLLWAAAAALKSFGCYVAFAAVNRQALQRGRVALWSLLFMVSVVWARLAPSRAFELSWGSAACVLFALVTLTVVLSARSLSEVTSMTGTRSRTGTTRAGAGAQKRKQTRAAKSQGAISAPSAPLGKARVTGKRAAGVRSARGLVQGRT